MNNAQKIALLYLLAVGMFLYGFAVARFKIFPFAYLDAKVRDIKAFTTGDTIDKNTSILDKLKNDTGFTPLRYTFGAPEYLYATHTPLLTPGLKARRDSPLIYLNEEYATGYRVIVGAMDFKNGFWGALLISPEGKVIHTWHLSTEQLRNNTKPDLLKILYGLHVDKDGSITFTMQEAGGGIVKVDACSNVVWNLPGNYHHTVTSDGKGALWTFTGTQYTLDQDMVKISAETGKILKTIDMTEVRKVNENTHIWNLTLPVIAPTPEQMAKAGNMTHGNDITPLREDVAASFEQFNVGDLLISYATTNLVFILDPETLKVKWWKIGISDYQHDPDWESDGRITIYSNERRAEENFSRIVFIDPKTNESGILFNGEKVKFRSPANGRQQRTSYNTRMITSANQGWAFEIDDAGEVVFSFINAYDTAENKTLFLSEALHLPPEYFEGKPWERCAAGN